jgi:hypothetical protein
MPDSKISALPSATVPLAGTEVLPIVQSSVTDKVTAADLLRQNGQTVTTSNPVLSLAQTWNAGGVTFTGLLFNATDTASATASNLLELQLGGVTRLQTRKDGVLLTLGGFRTINAEVSISTNAQLANNGAFSWSSTSSANNAGDTFIVRDAANTVALRNGANAQTFNIYRSYTDASNYSRLRMFLSGSTWNLTAEALGTGSASALSIQSGGNLSFASAGTTEQWRINSGNFIALADNAYDIGASGATRPRNIYTGTQFIAPDGDLTTPGFVFAGSTATGFYRDAGGGRIRVAVGGNYALNFANGQIGLPSDTAAIQLGASADTILTRDAANTLAQRNGTNAQSFKVYNTYTDASNYERFAINAQSGADVRLQTEKAGTGTVRSIVFGTNASGRWYIDGASGHFLAATDATYDIGQSGATRPRNIYASNAFVAGGGIDAISRMYIYTGTAIPAGGTTGAGYRMSSTADFGVFFGSGAPTLSAAKGSLYLRSDGSGTGDRMYVNTNGSTTWTAVTTAA